jgi:hypothetical protein
MSNKVYIVIIVVLLGVVGWMAYSMNTKDKEYVYVKQEYANLDQERMELAVDLEAMKLNYDTLTVTNADMQAKVDQQENELADLLKKVKNKDYDITKLKAEANTLRGIMKTYIAQIDSLNQANKQLAMERDLESSRANTAESNLQMTAEELKAQKEVTAKGAQLTTGEFLNTGVFARNSGKEVETDKASKTETIKSCFKVRKNQIATPGTKTLYVSIIGPDGKVLTGNKSGTAMLDGQETQYSIPREVDYQQQDTDVCVYYSAPQGYEFKKGNYKVIVYEGGATIGTSSVSLK